MAAYRTPLPALMAATLETAVSRVLDMDAASAERLDRLQGRSLRLELEGVGIKLLFNFTQRGIRVTAATDEEADTVVSGTPGALFAMAAPEELGGWGSAGSRVNISGDATLARDLERLFSKLDPDWEGGLSRVFGDVLGHQVAAGIRSGVEDLRKAADSSKEILGEALRRSDGPLLDRESMTAFADAVDETRDAVDRLEARIRILQQERAGE